MDGNEVHIIDTWDGKRKVKHAADFAGVRAAHVAQTAPPRTSFPLMGIRGRGSGEHLAACGVRGWCLDPVYMNEDPQQLDYTDLASAGVRVIVNLRRNWSTDCGGQGTVPPPDKWDQFIASAIQTIRDAKDVYAFTLFNEVNNPREWPSGRAPVDSGPRGVPV